MSTWKRYRQKLEYAAVLLLKKGVPLLSRKGCVRLSKAIGALAYTVDKKGRAVALANLEAAFGSQYSPADRERIARESYQYFVRTMVDLFWAPRLTRENYTKYIRFHGSEVLERLRDERKFGLTSHRAGFEWASLAVGYFGIPSVVLTENHKNRGVGEVITGLRTSSGHRAIEQDFSVLRLIRAVARKELVGFLIDLTVPPAQSATVIDAFGLKMCVSLLPAALYRRTGAFLTHMSHEPREDGTMDMSFSEPETFPEDATDQEICQQCWDFLEREIRARPETWLWAYKHFRFRPKEAEESRYPFYANVSSKFEKLRRQTAAKGR